MNIWRDFIPDISTTIKPKDFNRTFMHHFSKLMHEMFCDMMIDTAEYVEIVER
jgi:hypothetical protein